MRLKSGPVLCNYYVTYRCNAKCGFCDIWEKPSPLIKIEDVESNLRDLRKMGVKVIDFTGGEPLLHPQIGDFLQLAKEYGFITTLTSNGLLYPKRAMGLAGKVDMLHFSLDSSSREVHNAMRGINCFDAIVESIELARSIGERPDILFTVFDSNIDEITEVYEQITLPNNLMLILNPVFTYNGIGESLSENSLKALEKWASKPLVYLNEAFIKLRREGGNQVEDPVCKASSTTVVISPDNKLILPCYHLSVEEFPIKGKLLELWGTPKIKGLRKMEGRYKECQGCTINCYMQPSFAVTVNRFFWKALGSTWKYSLAKGTWKQLYS